MMSDSEFSLAAACCPEDEPDLYDTEEIFKLENGLDLMVSHNKKTMKSIANLVLAVNKMSKSLSQCGDDLSEDELCRAIMDCVVEETAMKTEMTFCTGQCRIIYRRSSSVNKCTLSDNLQKHLISSQKKSEEWKLEAITLKAGYSDRKVKFEMSRYNPTSDNSAETKTVLLSLTKDLHISCSLEDGTVVMKLERCNEEELDKIDIDLDMDRFLFFKRTTELTNTTFESVKYRGWFISTSCDNSNRSVEMCQVDAAQRVTIFSVRKLQ